MLTNEEWTRLRIHYGMLSLDSVRQRIVTEFYELFGREFNSLADLLARINGDGSVRWLIGGNSYIFSSEDFNPMSHRFWDKLSHGKPKPPETFRPQFPPFLKPYWGESQHPMYSFGLDAEFIIRDKVTHLPVSMIGKLGGNKKNPRRIPFGALQEDGVLAEINIHPAYSLFEWERNITNVLKYLEGEVSKMGCYVDYNSIEAEYPEDQLQTPLAWESGCEPDWNCWEASMNLAKPYGSRLRTCGGHIHVGVHNISTYKPSFRTNLAKCLDSIVGVPLTAIEPKNTRRTLYGDYGAFRPKPYGAEIRTPSNFWLKTAILRKFTFSLLCSLSQHQINKTAKGIDKRLMAECYLNQEYAQKYAKHHLNYDYPRFIRDFQNFYSKSEDKLKRSSQEAGIDLSLKRSSQEAGIDLSLKRSSQEAGIDLSFDEFIARAQIMT